MTEPRIAENRTVGSETTPGLVFFVHGMRQVWSSMLCVPPAMLEDPVPDFHDATGAVARAYTRASTRTSAGLSPVAIARGSRLTCVDQAEQAHALGPRGALLA